MVYHQPFGNGFVGISRQGTVCTTCTPAQSQFALCSIVCVSVDEAGFLWVENLYSYTALTQCTLDLMTDKWCLRVACIKLGNVELSVSVLWVGYMVDSMFKKYTYSFRKTQRESYNMNRNGKCKATVCDVRRTSTYRFYRGCTPNCVCVPTYALKRWVIRASFNFMLCEENLFRSFRNGLMFPGKHIAIECILVDDLSIFMMKM